MDFTYLASIEFYTDNQKRIREYYQTKDNFIRESSFDDENGWFTNGNGIITKDAKEKSPITVTRWNGSSGTEIRMYFLDKDHNIRECKGLYKSSTTTWQNSTILKSASDIDIATGSQLAAARPDKDDTTIRLFYQEKGTNKYVRELRYISRKTRWIVQGAQMPGAAENSRLAAVSDRATSGVVRLYYQGDDKKIWEGLWTSDGCSNRKFISKKFELINQAPISAISWYGPDKDLQIRLYSVLKSNTTTTTIAQIAYDDNWDDDATPIATLGTGALAVTTCRDTKAGADHPICVFYQPSQMVIDLQVVAATTETAATTATTKFVTPKGIPTSRQN